MDNFKIVKPIRINLLGGCSLICEDVVLSEDQGRSLKVWNLFAYLVLNRNRQLSQSELIEILCSDEKIEDPGKAVKELVYRLRCNLAESNLPALNYIVQGGGVYGWNNTLPIEIDVDLLVEKWDAANKAEPESYEALSLYLQAIDLYKGKLLPCLEYEEWTISLAVHYHAIFTECVKIASRLLWDQEDYLSIISICDKAIALEPYEEDMYIIYIGALIKMHKQKEALAEYELIRGKLYNELGVNPSETLSDLYNEIIKNIKTVELDLSNIINDLKEKGAIVGSFFIEYEHFKEVYRFVVRGAERSGVPVQIMLITICDRKDKSPNSPNLNIGMEKLKSEIIHILRKGDLFAQYSGSQFVVLLTGTTFENRFIVAQRIVEVFKKSEDFGDTELEYKVEPITPCIELTFKRNED